MFHQQPTTLSTGAEVYGLANGSLVVVVRDTSTNVTAATSLDTAVWTEINGRVSDLEPDHELELLARRRTSPWPEPAPTPAPVRARPRFDARTSRTGFAVVRRERAELRSRQRAA